MNEQEKKTKAEVITAPIAIIIAGALIAGAVYFSANKGPASSALNDGAVAKQQLLKGDLNQMAAISASDHIRGNLNAEVLIVEYSDTECPFCKVLHNTMNEVMGLNISQFNTCLASGKYTKRIDDDIKNAQATGGNGTPWSIVVAKNGKKYQLSGAQPLASIKQLIETALQERSEE